MIPRKMQPEMLVKSKSSKSATNSMQLPTTKTTTTTSTSTSTSTSRSKSILKSTTVINMPNDNVAVTANALSKSNETAFISSVCSNLNEYTDATMTTCHYYVMEPLPFVDYCDRPVMVFDVCREQERNTHERHKECKQAAKKLDDRKQVAHDARCCCPAPVFIIFISLLEIGVFVYDFMTVESHTELNSTNIPSESMLIYRPDRRLEIWRFISYMALHANWFHLSFNVVIQLLYGLPLELVHGSSRIAVIYLAGVFAGSLGTSVVDSDVYLVGASGGVYALLAAQLANILLNFGQMRYGISQLVSVIIFVACDLGYAIYTKYISTETIKTLPAVSYIAHLTGALAGFTMGLMVLKNFDANKIHTTLTWWLALGVYASFTIFAIVFNLINTVTAQMLEEEGEVMRQRLLHDLGVS